MEWILPHKATKNPHGIVRVCEVPVISSNNGVAADRNGAGRNHGSSQDVGLRDSNQDVGRNDGGSLEEDRSDGGNLDHHHNSVVVALRRLHRQQQMPAYRLTVFSYPSPSQKLKRWLILKSFLMGYPSGRFTFQYCYLSTRGEVVQGLQCSCYTCCNLSYFGRQKTPGFPGALKPL